MGGPIVLDSYVKGPIFLTSWKMWMFSLRDFSRLLVLLVFGELTVTSVWQPAINGYKNKKKANRLKTWSELSERFENQISPKLF